LSCAITNHRPTLRQIKGELEQAKRPDFTPDSALSPQGLAELRHPFAMLSTSSLEQGCAAWSAARSKRAGAAKERE
jgi:hypothetical protein